MYGAGDTSFRLLYCTNGRGLRLILCFDEKRRFVQRVSGDGDRPLFLLFRDLPRSALVFAMDFTCLSFRPVTFRDALGPFFEGASGGEYERLLPIGERVRYAREGSEG